MCDLGENFQSLEANQKYLVKDYTYTCGCTSEPLYYPILLVSKKGSDETLRVEGNKTLMRYIEEMLPKKKKKKFYFTVKQEKCGNKYAVVGRNYPVWSNDIVDIFDYSDGKVTRV
jgi:hypothetical protein